MPADVIFKKVRESTPLLKLGTELDRQVQTFSSRRHTMKKKNEAVSSTIVTIVTIKVLPTTQKNILFTIWKQGPCVGGMYQKIVIMNNMRSTATFWGADSYRQVRS